ncbi:MAG: DNA polymerase IV [Thermoplasmata archaeon]|uniref:DNA polymerase IV n=1 Tax=Candidatus Sysuiplasma superficiale TaxID=2823368 RepID=A0A8J8CEF8_9ARCH|nr:DNA polymerase IV [Candidatus Sysuiplasma superficiale]MCL4347183.1 DNA polymerase IV [Candidatus Thermoplasmatota archaeon]
MPGRIIAHVDLDYFYAQCEELRRPELKGRPVVVCIYSGRTEDSGAVSTSNYEARKIGIRSGMPIVQAKRIAGSNTVFLSADIEYYESVSERIMSLLRSYTPVMEQASVDEAYLDLSEVVSDFDGGERKAREIKNAILSSEHLTCSIGVSSNKLLSKMAAGVSKPDGLTVVRPEEALDFLAPMPAGKLFGVGRVTERRLSEMGIQTVDDLRSVSPEILKKQFGSSMGMWLYNASRGVDEEQVMDRKREQYGRIITLKEDTRDRSVLVDNASRLLNEVVRQVKADALRFKTVSFLGIMSDLSARTKNRSLPDFTDDFEQAARIMPILVDEFLSEHPGNLRRMGVKVSNLSEDRGQKSLFDFA